LIFELNLGGETVFSDQIYMVCLYNCVTNC